MLNMARSEVQIGFINRKDAKNTESLSNISLRPLRLWGFSLFERIVEPDTLNETSAHIHKRL